MVQLCREASTRYPHVRVTLPIRRVCGARACARGPARRFRCIARLRSDFSQQRISWLRWAPKQPVFAFGRPNTQPPRRPTAACALVAPRVIVCLLRARAPHFFCVLGLPPRLAVSLNVIPLLGRLRPDSRCPSLSLRAPRARNCRWSHFAAARPFGAPLEGVRDISLLFFLL